MAPLPAEALARIHALPDRAAERLRRVLAAAGHPRPHVAAQLVTGALNAAIRLLHDGEDRDTVTDVAAVAARQIVRAAASRNWRALKARCVSVAEWWRWTIGIR